MKRKRVVLIVVGILVLVGVVLTGMYVKNKQGYESLIDKASEVPKWEADPRPLQSENVVLKKLKKLNRKNDNKDVSLTDGKLIVIPGLRGAWSIDHKTKKAAFGTGWVPQGLTQSKDHYYVSAYDGEHRLNSVIFQIDKQSKKYVKTLILSSKAHVGGITYEDEHQRLIYSDDTNQVAGFGYIDQAVIDEYQASVLKKPIESQKKEWKIGLRTSAITTYQNQLVVAKYGFHPNERSIVTIPLNQAGYPPKITDRGSQLLADAIGTADKKELEKVFIEALLEEGYISSFNHGWDRMQGISLSKSGMMIVSQSNGLKPGKLLIRYRVPDLKNWRKSNVTKDFTGPDAVTIPRSVEEVSINDEETELAMIFESGAKKYREAPSVLLPGNYMDRILVLPMEIQ
ncbi:hypothetical protein UAS_01289 [Enterococcus asini ATCC 700915]|uniref:Uncharacterized protein n=1 Tax=Enterococcus asini ATCC 700915 TaxID=1158606 RepID=R2PQL7_9ENTE|nr:hypothetical protein [Enterococcus asini]EOH86827.1 hypothetical protein UAS_01289 [Enterococcus asini ATCC 700915]EOT58250.1 hypothetical protein I579_01813 [Enterococcus asini ATCC 700915]